MEIGADVWVKDQKGDNGWLQGIVVLKVRE
jgi:hypothetical protein